MSREKQVTKVIVYYSDGTSEEIVKMPVEPDEISKVWEAWGTGQEDPGQ